MTKYPANGRRPSYTTGEDPETDPELAAALVRALKQVWAERRALLPEHNHHDASPCERCTTAAAWVRRNTADVLAEAYHRADADIATRRAARGGEAP